MAKKRLKKEDVERALREAKGFQTVAAKNLNVSFATLKNYLKYYPELNNVIEEVRENMIDFVESKLFELIKAGDKTAIIFYLKTQAKHRGYSEVVEFKPSKLELERIDISEITKL